jgi:hypothetical protein
VRNNPLKRIDPTGHADQEVVPALEVGKIAHFAIELDYVLNVAPQAGYAAYASDLPFGRRAFNIPGGGPSGRAPGYPDIYYVKGDPLVSGQTKYLYEIKPDNPAAIADGIAQMLRHLGSSGCAPTSKGPCAAGDYYPSNTGVVGERLIPVVPGVLNLRVREIKNGRASTGVLAYTWEWADPKKTAELTSEVILAIFLAWLASQAAKGKGQGVKQPLLPTNPAGPTANPWTTSGTNQLLPNCGSAILCPAMPYIQK